MAHNIKDTKKPKRRKELLRKLFFAALFFSFAMFVLGMATIAYLVHDVPPLSLTEAEVSETSFVVDTKGNPISPLHYIENRVTVSIDTMPEHLVEGVVVMEDIRFYDHFGFSPRDFIRGVWLTITGQDRQGASTITQQVARNRILKNLSWSVKRKVQEIFVAIKMEKNYSKKEILEAYLNELFMGGSAKGMEAAAKQYFGKSVSDLNLAESAMLAGIIPSPNSYRPTVASMVTAKNRQAVVLDQMLKHNKITEEEKQAALAYEIKLATAPVSVGDGGNLTNYFVDHVIREVEDILMSKQKMTRDEAIKKIYEGGITIHTTLDLEMQKAAEKAAIDIITMPNGINDRMRAAALLDDDPVVREAAKDEKFQWDPRVTEYGDSMFKATTLVSVQPQVSMLIIEPSTGFIRVWLGGRDMVARQGIDRVATIQNQPGSSIKPLLVYGPALASGQYTAASTIDDAPVSFPTGDPDIPEYIPRNYNINTFYGHTSIRNAIPPSHNVTAVKLLQQIGIRNSIQWAEKLGISSFVKSGQANDIGLASALGGLTDGVTIYEMVRAYNVFNNNGILVEPSSILKITERSGTVLYQAPAAKQEIVISEQLAWLMTDILKAVVNPGGSGIQLRSVGQYQGDAAGKTGTTNSNADALFLGYTPAYTGGVWIGNDDSLTGIIQRNAAGEPLLRDPRKPSSPDNWLRGGLPPTVGSGLATAIFGRTLTYYTGNQNLPSFDALPPERLGMVRATVCKVSGKLPSPLCPSSDLREEWFIPGTEPKEICDFHVSVKICTESNQLATEYCPAETVVEQIRIRREPYAEVFDKEGNQLHPNDVANQVPFETCTIHDPNALVEGNDGETGGP